VEKGKKGCCCALLLLLLPLLLVSLLLVLLLRVVRPAAAASAGIQRCGSQASGWGHTSGCLCNNSQQQQKQQPQRHPRVMRHAAGRRLHAQSHTCHNSSCNCVLSTRCCAIMLLP
jgi:hypothetical protein